MDSQHGKMGLQWSKYPEEEMTRTASLRRRGEEFHGSNMLSFATNNTASQLDDSNVFVSVGGVWEWRRFVCGKGMGGEGGGY